MNSPFHPDHDNARDLSPNKARDRDSLFLKAEMRLPEKGLEIEARVRNLSSGGLMAEAPVHVDRGDSVEINMRNIGWIGGSVAWTSEGRFGVAFNQPIDPKIVRKPVGQANLDVPTYLRKLDAKPATSKLRRF